MGSGCRGWRQGCSSSVPRAISSRLYLAPVVTAECGYRLLMRQVEKDKKVKEGQREKMKLRKKMGRGYCCWEEREALREKKIRMGKEKEKAMSEHKGKTWVNKPRNRMETVGEEGQGVGKTTSSRTVLTLHKPTSPGPSPLRHSIQHQKLRTSCTTTSRRDGSTNGGGVGRAGGGCSDDRKAFNSNTHENSSKDYTDSSSIIAEMGTDDKNDIDNHRNRSDHLHHLQENHHYRNRSSRPSASTPPFLPTHTTVLC